MSTPHDRIEAKLGLAGPPLGHVRAAPPRVSDYELVRRIGQGSYGEVWLARSALGTWRAVKVVYCDNFKDARPYEREFTGIRRFKPLSRSNEGFVDILQVDRDDAEGWFYYVMELADAAEPRGSDRSSVVSGRIPVPVPTAGWCARAPMVARPGADYWMKPVRPTVGPMTSSLTRRAAWW